MEDLKSMSLSDLYILRDKLDKITNDYANEEFKSIRISSIEVLEGKIGVRTNKGFVELKELKDKNKKLLFEQELFIGESKLGFNGKIMNEYSWQFVVIEYKKYQLYLTRFYAVRDEITARMIGVTSESLYPWRDKKIIEKKPKLVELTRQIYEHALNEKIVDETMKENESNFEISDLLMELIRQRIPKAKQKTVSRYIRSFIVEGENGSYTVERPESKKNYYY